MKARLERWFLTAPLPGWWGACALLILFATHDLDAAAAYAERIVVLDRGRVAADGKPADVLTEALLKEVFHVHAQIVRDGDRIHVLADL